jgi:hypothetical protein
VISFIIPRFPYNNEVLDKFLNEILTIYNYKNDKEKKDKFEELSNFINSKVSIISEDIGKKYIKKGNIKLKVELDKELPQNEMQVYFWIRMTCEYESGTPSNENLLLIGRTGFKEYILKEWLSSEDKDYEIYYLTKNTEVENLMGVYSLDDEEKLEIQEKNFNDDKNKYLKKNEKEDACVKYIEMIIGKFGDLKSELSDGSMIGNSCKKRINTKTSFHLGIIPKCYLFGKKIILKGIENPSPSVIERLNPLLENPRNLVLTEDNQNILMMIKFSQNYILKIQKKLLFL